MKSELITFRARAFAEPGEKCAASTGTTYSGPKRCGRTAKEVVITAAGERLGCCGIHLQRIDALTNMFGVTR